MIQLGERCDRSQAIEIKEHSDSKELEHSVPIGHSSGLKGLDVHVEDASGSMTSILAQAGKPLWMLV